MYLQSIKSVKHNAAMSFNRSILKKSRHIGFGVFIVHSFMRGTMKVQVARTSRRHERIKQISFASETNIIITGRFSSVSNPPLDARKPPKFTFSGGFQKVFSTGCGFQSAFSGSKNAALEGFL
jgi:hypothetical protein